MATVYLLDTNICIAFLEERDRSVKSRLTQLPAERVVLCSVVKAELLFAARKSAHVERNLARFDEFFGIYTSLPFDDLAAEWYARVRLDLSRAGRTIGSNDLQIASIALAADATVVTRNDGEFRRVAGLRVERW